MISEVIPTYYEKRDKWVEMMRAAVDMGLHRFSSERMLTEYYNMLYQPSTTLRHLKEQIKKTKGGPLTAADILRQPVKNESGLSGASF